MIHTDSDEGPVPIEVLQSRAAQAKEADLAAALERAERFEAAYGEMTATAKAELEAGTVARIDRERLTIERDAAIQRAEEADEALAGLRRAVVTYSDGHHRECQKAHWDDGPCGCGYDLLRKEMGWGNG